MRFPRTTPQQLLGQIENVIDQQGISPTVRELADAFGYSSTSSIQNLLYDLRASGDISWLEGKSRSIRILRSNRFRIPIRGVIAAHSLIESFTDGPTVDWLEMAPSFQFRGASQDRSRLFALHVSGDSMKGALIDDGDLVILQQPLSHNEIKNGSIVAARVASQTTLKYFYLDHDQITLQPANSNYPATTLSASCVDVQGIYVGLFRGMILG